MKRSRAFMGAVLAWAWVWIVAVAVAEKLARGKSALRPRVRIENYNRIIRDDREAHG